ncbi:SMAD/FHA domain-containing protein [Russula aff. rugulosa BPL654]|nr:SMAD/FHA domain-containing protein [Russula aff. rugulosa BPL654]
MPRRSPSPDSHNRNRNSDNRDKYRGRRDDAAGYQRNADRESRDGYRDRRGYSERDTRRSYHDGNEFNDNDRRRRDGGDVGQRRKNGYDSHDDGRRTRDEGSRDHRSANRPDEGDDKNLRRDEHRDRRERGDESSRRSASPRRSRPHSHSPSRPRSPSATSPPPDDKAKPNFAPSGLLAAATNTVKNSDGTSTLLKYNEPPEARKPLVGWRLYVFKGDEQVDLLHIHRQSAYLIGRDRTVTDIPLEHPSSSKQHAVIQYRLVQQKDEFGNSKGVIKPFVIDLESTNGTHVNGEAIPTSRYYELKASDVIKFGTSNREYVLLHDEVS